MVCVRETLKKRKTMKSPREKSTCSHPQHERKDIVDESERAAFWTLSEVERTALRKLVKAMAHLHSIYVANIRTFVEEQ